MPELKEGLEEVFIQYIPDGIGEIKNIYVGEGNAEEISAVCQTLSVVQDQAKTEEPLIINSNELFYKQVFKKEEGYTPGEYQIYMKGKNVEKYRGAVKGLIEKIARGEFEEGRIYKELINSGILVKTKEEIKRGIVSALESL